MACFRRFLDVIEKIQMSAIWVLYVSVIVLVNFQVLNRFYLHWPIVWTADLSIVLFIWLAFLSASIAFRKNTHFRMKVLVDMAGSGRLRQVLELFSFLVVFTLGTILAFEGIALFVQGLDEILPGLQMKMAWAYGAVPLSMITGLLFVVERVFKDVSEAGRTEQNSGESV